MTPARLPSALLAAFALATAFALAACGGGSGTTSITALPPTTYTAVSSVAQKGPFRHGATVSAHELGLNLAATGSTHTYTTDSDVGSFTPDTPFTTPYIGVSASGSYFDEVSNRFSDGPVTLQSYADLSAEHTLNLNLLTTLAYARIEHLVNQQGLPFTAARAQAEREVLAAFGIVAEEAPGAFGTLALGNAQARDGDHMLAALSSMFTQGHGSAAVQALLDAVQADIGANGAITDSATRQTLATYARQLNVERVGAHLNALYASGAAPVDPAELGRWLDRDGDGVIVANEIRVDDATPASSVTLSAAFSAAHAGQTLTDAGGELRINGVAATAPVVLQASDTVTLAPPAVFADGALKTYLMSGSTPIQRVSFVKGLASLAVSTPGPLPVGLAQRFTATGRFNDGHVESLGALVTWSTADASVADIDATTGLADGLLPGSTTVSASSGSVAGSAPLAVVDATVRAIALAPATLATGVGITRALTATGTFTDGTVADVTESVTWASQAEATATVMLGRVTGVALGTTAVSATLLNVSASANVAVTSDAWSAAAAMPTSRVAGASATLLPLGRVLVIGGVGDGATGSAAVDLYDPVAMSWAAAGSRAPMGTARTSHTATRLADGRVLVCGGSTLTGTVAQGYVNNDSVEIYDPVANTWTPAAPMSVARSHHTATLLSDGKVLVAGGEDAHYLVTDSAELYDPSTRQWSLAAHPLKAARSQHSATLLANGRVLIAGGFDIDGGTLAPLTAAEIYDPASRGSTLTAPTLATHAGHTATRLPDGRVLVAAGGNAQAEIYDPATARWTATPSLQSARNAATATLLPSGEVLLTGGTQTTPNTERYTPSSNTWSPAASAPVNRDAPITALLPDGSTLVCGGAANAASTSCSIYW